jgi:hypothetical protein
MRGGPSGRRCRRPGAPITYVGDIDGGPPRRRCRRPGSARHLCQRHRWWAPWEALSETRERPPPMSKTSMAVLLGGAIGDLGLPPPMSETSMEAPREVSTEIRERPPPMLETSMAGPLGGTDEDPGVPTTYVGDVYGGPLGRRCQRSGSAHHLCRRH